MTHTPAADNVGELRFLADSRQQMGYDRSGAAMEEAATEIEALRARVAENAKHIQALQNWQSAAMEHRTELKRKIDEAVKALEPFALISSEGVIGSLATKGHVEITTCAEYFHRAADLIAFIRGETDQ